MSEPVLKIRDLCVEFAGEKGPIRAVDGLSLDVFEGETVGIVGESGCGKSVLNKNFIGLLDPNGFICACWIPTTLKLPRAKSLFAAGIFWSYLISKSEV